jgi:hypothetical protein
MNINKVIKIRENKILEFFEKNPNKLFTYTEIMMGINTSHNRTNYNLRILLSRKMIIRIKLSKKLQKDLGLDTRTKFVYKYNNGKKLEKGDYKMDGDKVRKAEKAIDEFKELRKSIGIEIQKMIDDHIGPCDIVNCDKPAKFYSPRHDLAVCDDHIVYCGIVHLEKKSLNKTYFEKEYKT